MCIAVVLFSLHYDSVAKTDHDNVQSNVDVDVSLVCPQQQVVDSSVTDDVEQTDSDNSVCDSNSDCGKVTADVFRSEQQNDESLKKC